MQAEQQEQRALAPAAAGEGRSSEYEITSERREQLILEHLPQVRLIARRIYERIPDFLTLEDLVSAGTLGLIAAIDRYDARQDVKLRTYAEYKIRGAILDSLRQMDWVPRQQRRRSRQIENAIAVLEQEFHRVPDEQEIAEFLGLDVSAYREWLSESRNVTIGSLEAAALDHEGSSDGLRFLADSEEHWPSEILERSQLEAALARAIDHMPKVERTVLSLYFYEDLTLREIAKLLNLHESRISQLKTQAILRLRSLLRNRWIGESGLL